MSFLRNISALSLVLGLGVPALAHAEPDLPPAKRAEALFQEAKMLMNEGRLDEACPKLEQARALDGGGGTVLALALCHERQGRLAQALDEFRDALALARAADRSDRIELSTQHIADLQARVPRPADASKQPETAEPQAETAPAVATEPAASLASKPATKPTAEPTPKPQRPSPADKARVRNADREAMAWLAGGIGVTGVAIGSYYGIRAIRLRSDAEAACGGPRCKDERGVQLDQQSARAGTVSTVTFCVAGAALAASAWLFLTSDSKSAVQVGAAPEVAGMSLVARGRF